MTIDFYYLIGSSPCRAVMLTAKALGVTLNLKELDLTKGEHLKPEFIKINPQHTIPTLVDNGFVVTESRAIMAYLVEQYGKDDSLYPKDAKKKAIVNQRLYFDMGTLYQRFAEYFYPLFRGGSLEKEKKEKVEEALEFLNTFLEGKKYVAGDHITIADYSILATVSTIEVGHFDVSKYPNIHKWYMNAKSVVAGYEEINQKGIEVMIEYYNQAIKNKTDSK